MNPQTLHKPMIGFTGTNGKTTTILITKHILEQCGLNPAVLEAWKGSMVYARFLDDAKTKDYDCLLLEVPADALRQKQIDGIFFQGGALTNITVDHLTSCRTPENYTALKSAFFNRLPERAKAVINADDPKALALAQEGYVDYLTYAVEYPQAMIVATNIRRQKQQQQFDLTVNAEFTGFTNKLVTPGSAIVNLSLLGHHNIANALLAASVALLFVPEVQAVAQALTSFPGIHRNLEIIANDHYNIMDDAATNPAAIHAALRAVTPLTDKRIHLLYGMYGGGGVMLNQCNARELAAWLKKHPDHELFITRSMYHCKNKYQVRINEEKAFLEELKNNGIQFAYFPDLPDAIDSLLSHAQCGDLILLLGGPVLARARDLIVAAVGENPESRRNTIPTMIPANTDMYAQSIHHNPT